MYLLALLLLVASSFYLLNLYEKFSNDQVAKGEINQAWEGVKNDAKNKNPFFPGRIKKALKSYKSDMEVITTKTADIVDENRRL